MPRCPKVWKGPLKQDLRKNFALSASGEGALSLEPLRPYDVGSASLRMMLVNMLEGRFISEHDYDIASRIADTLCGGTIERGSLVDETWLLDLERRHFVELAQTQKTQDRIAHTMATGKPLRN